MLGMKGKVLIRAMLCNSPISTISLFTRKIDDNNLEFLFAVTELND